MYPCNCRGDDGSVDALKKGKDQQAVRLTLISFRHVGLLPTSPRGRGLVWDDGTETAPCMTLTAVRRPTRDAVKPAGLVWEPQTSCETDRSFMFIDPNWHSSLRTDCVSTAVIGHGSSDEASSPVNHMAASF